MATPMKSMVFVLSLIVLSLLVLSSEARVSAGLPTKGKRTNDELLLREITINIRKCKYNHKRSMLGGKLGRPSPAGPDPGHH